MLDLTKANAPCAVLVNGAFYAIKTDFRYWLNFSHLIRNENHLLLDFDFLYEEEIPEDRKAGFDALVDFYINKKELPRILAGDSDIEILDYNLDSELIFAAFYEQYGIDLISQETRLHWWKFKALLSGLHGTKLNEVMGYRAYNEGAKTDWKQNARENKRRWELPQELTEEEKKELEEFDSLISGKENIVSV